MPTAKTYLKKLGLAHAVCLEENSSDFINRISREYALYVLDSRAIPSFTDGLKYVQRMALWVLRNRAEQVKTVALTGQMLMEELYVHGDKSCNDAISLLAAPYCNNVTLITPRATFGTRKSPVKGIGAARYTYVQRSPFAQKVLYQDLDIVPMTENHDGSNMIPVTFFPILPLVLLNGVKGIATGWSTNILPRKLEDLVKATQEAIATGKVTTKLMPYYEKYNADIKEIEKNKYAICGKLKIKNTSTVVITELPPGMAIESFRGKLIDLQENGCITSWTDDSTDDINITIKMRRTDIAPHTVDSLTELFKLKIVETERIVVIKGDTVKQYDSAEELVEDWVKWRLELYETRYQYLLRREQEKSIYWLSVLACHEGASRIKPVPHIVAEIENKAELKAHITKLIKKSETPLDEDVVERIANIPVYRWTIEGYNAVVGKLEECEKNMDHYESLIASKAKRKAEFKKEVGAIL